jgi:hypothetical protein
MKRKTLPLPRKGWLTAIVTVVLIISCKKEYSYEGGFKNQPPVANAGRDTTVATTSCGSNGSAILDGSKSADPDNKITSYLWTKISGPSSFDITNGSAVKTQVTNLVEGIYQFELNVENSAGLSAKDTVQITIKFNNHPPVANAGADTTIAQPSTIAYLVGTNSTDPDNNIVSYEWTKISGPYLYTIGNWQEVKANATVPDVGVYLFQLEVADACGLLGKDTVQVTVQR